MKSGHAAKSKNLPACTGIGCLLGAEWGARLLRNGVLAWNGFYNGGRGGSCDHLYECNSGGLSFICDLKKGYDCPDCPVRIQTEKDMLESANNNPQAIKAFPGLFKNDKKKEE